ncbi:MAG: hypothetical protein Q8L34_01785 [Candidatus Woesearchaeota archaeon]|nr:hypothetical protein [Candidatus Woesearchaeota archaeon]
MGENDDTVGIEEKDDDVYSDPEELLEDEDELDDVDEGFMKGYNDSETVIKCTNCKKLIEGDGIEEEFDDEKHKFCSQECLNEYEEKKLSKL